MDVRALPSMTVSKDSAKSEPTPISGIGLSLRSGLAKAPLRQPVGCATRSTCAVGSAPGSAACASTETRAPCSRGLPAPALSII